MRLAVSLWCFALVAQLGCGDNAHPGPTDLALDRGRVTLAVHDTTTLTASLTSDRYGTVEAWSSSDALTWDTSDPSVATVTGGDGQTAVVTAVALGDATISVTADGLEASVPVTVTGPPLAAIDVTPSNPTLQKGDTLQLTATGMYVDGSSADLTSVVTWSSGDPTLATVASSGLASAVAAGTVVVTAADPTSSIIGSTTVTVKNASLVSIVVTPANSSIAKGTTRALTATGMFSDGSTADLTTSALWSSSDATIAPISTSGVATGQALGTVTITATDVVTGIAGMTKLTVRAPDLVSLAITPAAPTIAKGTLQAFVATGTYTDSTTRDVTSAVTWATANSSIATITSGPVSYGVATGKGIGTTAVTATDPTTSIYATTTLTVSAAKLSSIAVTPADPTIAKSTKQVFAAVGTYTDGTTQNLTNTVTWGSSNTAVATISNAPATRGIAAGISAGMSTITATDPASAITGSTILTVTSAILVSITVTPADPSIPSGRKQQFTATGTFSDSTTQDITLSVGWGSSDSLVATISNVAGSQGLAKATGVGTTRIIAIDGGTGINGSTKLAVTPAVLVSITISPTNPTIAAGSSQAFLATGTYSDNSTRDITTVVTWKSSNTGVATISNAAGTQGVANALSAGSATISATDPATLLARSTVLTVTP
jgi:uncharacterized protein YjdB